MKTRFVRPALLVIPALLLAACGGGGGGGSSSGSNNGALSSTLVVSSANAKPVAADGLDASTNTGGASAGASLVTGVQVDTGSGPSVGPATLSAIALKLAGKALGRPALPTGVVVNETGACSMGGTITITGNVSGGASLVTGDTLTITATNCVETVDAAVSTMSGSFTIAVVAGNFNPDATTFPQKITMTMVANNLTIASNGVTNASNGDLKIDLTQNSATAAVSTLSGASLSNSYTHGSVQRSVTLKNYTMSQESVGTQVRSSVTATVVTTNPRLGNGVIYQVSTPTPIVTDLSLVVAGSLKITGANSGLLLTVTTTPNNFTLAVDTNGDGTYESTSAVTATELRDLL